MSKQNKFRSEDKLRIAIECSEGRKGSSAAGREIGADESTVRKWVRQYEAEGAQVFFTEGKNKHYPKELKEAAVKDYMAGKGSLRGICKIYKIRNKMQLKDWIKVYNGHKELKTTTGGSRMTKARKTTLEERIALARECIASGRNYGEMAIKYNVSYQQVYNWTNKFAELGEAALEDRRGQRTAQQTPRTPEEELKIRIAQLEHENYMLKMERDLLKKLEEIERRRG